MIDGRVYKSYLNQVKLINDEMGVKAHSCIVDYNEDEFQEVQKSSSHVIFISIQQFEKFKNQLSNNVEY